MKRKTLTVIIVSIVALLAAVSWWAIRNHTFFSSLRAPEAPIEEVIIRGYGNVPGYLLEAAKSAVEEKIGVRASIDSSQLGFSDSEQPFSFYYNRVRDQFDGDIMWGSVAAFVDEPSSKRIIMIVDVDAYTELQPERPYILSRSSPNVSVILISAYRLQKLSDTSEEPAPPDLAAARIQKLALRTLGASVFLEGFSITDETDVSCVMYRGRILSELDKQGDDFCGKNKEKLEDYFVIVGARAE